MQKFDRTFVFTLNDTLYDATFQRSQARLAAVEAMIENGLPVDVETAYNNLEEVVNSLGSDAPDHFNVMLERMGFGVDSRIIAAGVVAYREVSRAALRPYPDVQIVLLGLRDKQNRLVLLSSGDPVKEWEKLIILGLAHLFHAVFIEKAAFGKEFVTGSLDRVGVAPNEAILVSGNEDELKAASELGLETYHFAPRIPGRTPRLPLPTGSRYRTIKRLDDLLKI